ncbi:MAG: ABC transporter ATP-binding protein [Geovibrio sp.]|uniref:ABC transporter ATP-binding protein n=1 Tax=Geovibrio ferrireducens TaxID=46201 RepID=UPI00224632AC|nr:ABC transporter ATP-binding protein [Geovibrio ferrireducens]MCD8568085.1 ABC transporter ATP-binding protein [Geovibrio sp.]
MNSDKIISIENLEHSYGKNKVLHGVSFTVEKGKTFGLLGKNGAGKTTTINIMMGFLAPDKGKCLVLGEAAHSLSPEGKRRIGLLHEGHLCYEFMNINQTEKFYKSFYPQWDVEIFDYLMKKLGLSRRHKIKHMSCGQRSQVALAVLMAQNADVLILDDFSMGLDAGYRRLFLDHLNFYVKERKKTVLITSHIVQDLERFVDDALIIDKGRVLRSAPLSELKDGLYGYRVKCAQDLTPLEAEAEIRDVSHTSAGYEIISDIPPKDAPSYFTSKTGVDINPEYFDITLEDAFIALTGKY